MADYGLRIRNASGVYTLTPADRITRILGSVNTGTSDGSHYDGALYDAVFVDSNEIFYFLVPQFKPNQQFSNLSVALDAPTMRWTFQDPAYAINYVIYYGAY